MKSPDKYGHLRRMACRGSLFSIKSLAYFAICQALIILDYCSGNCLFYFSSSQLLTAPVKMS